LKADGDDRVSRADALSDCAVFSWTEPDGNAVTVFGEGDPLFDAMLADISEARERVWIESYIFADDTIGREFVDSLARSSARGVDVRVRVDAVGSRFGFSGGSARRLRAAGARFHWCHPWQWRRPWTFHHRNHRKLLVVDERSAYVGGFNISDLNSRRMRGEARWRDTHVRVAGPIVREAAAAFESFMRGKLEWCGDERGSLYFHTNHARNCRHRLRYVLRRRFAKARYRIWLTTPYFVPDSKTQRDLCAAALRGVDVRVLVPAKNDVRIVQWAGRAAYSDLLGAGVRVFEYQPRTLHAKTLLADDDWSTIGTANFDYRSLFINYELNLVGRSPRLNIALASLFEDDLQSSNEIRCRQWARRPLSRRFAEFVGWGARRWL
jgi:cardiolipin synthase